VACDSRTGGCSSTHRLKQSVYLIQQSTEISGLDRRSLERYVTGLLTDLPRKHCETIAQAVANTSLEQLQHLLTDAAWDPLVLDEQRVRLLVDHSPPNGILLLDDTGLPKQGKASVGVQHQYSGTLGKQGNCQVVVSAEYVVAHCSSSQPLHWPVSARLYVPQVWTDDRPRCERVRVPESVTCASKPALALLLLERALAWRVPFATVVADAGYGIPSCVRTHVCPSCGLVLDRDENAARNILRAGQARQGAVALAAVLN
jgi:SRSO17 transposase